MSDSGFFDQLSDSIETLLPAIFHFLHNNSFFDKIEKYKNYIKILIIIIFAIRVYYRITILDEKEEGVNLIFKIIGYIINIIIVLKTIKKVKNNKSKKNN